MTKISIRLMTFIIAAGGLTMLIAISSCVTSERSTQVNDNMTALRQIFTSAVTMDQVPITQDAQAYGRPEQAKISEIKSGSDLLGYCVESKVVSRSGPFKIRVLLDTQLYVKQATVVSYPWDRGRGVYKRTFTDQFKGKGPGDPIKPGKDIDAITGATISSRVMAQGVRDTIKLLELIREKKYE